MSIPTFNVGGLATGLDTNNIINQLVSIKGAPLAAMQRQQKAFTTQVSTLGDVMNKLRALSDASSNLARDGVLATTATSAQQQAKVVASKGAVAGRFALSVEALAVAAQARSTAFASEDAPVRGGTLTLGVAGQTYDVTVADGATLLDVAGAINQAGAPLRANVLFDGTSAYLSITNLNTGHVPGTNPADALTVTESSTGTLGQALGLVVTRQAQNARVVVDGLTFERRDNQASDIIPGVTLALQEARPGVTEDLVLAPDLAKTALALQDFVAAYNVVSKVLGQNINVTTSSDRSVLLVGNTAIRSLQSRMQENLSTTVSGAGTFKALSEIGLKTNRDGTLSLDEAALQRAVERDPGSVDRLFSDATAGMGLQFKTLADQFAGPEGLLQDSQDAINQNITRLKDQQTALQARLDTYRLSLLAQFTAMEKVVGGLKAIDSFLTLQNQKKGS